MKRRLIIFTRYPEPGKVKTRLIPSLGPEGAANLQHQLTHHTLGWADEVRDIEVEMRYTGGDAQQMASLYGARRYVDQGDGDLGQRLARAFSEAFAEGCQRVAAIGTDCPDLTDRVIHRALELQNNEVLIRPATDGGYCLIALSGPHVAVFEGIEWGTGRVFAQTFQRAAALGLVVKDDLPALHDIDRPEDLVHFPSLSVIVPTLNEEAHLASTLERVRTAPGVEVIVSDGGSTDRTLAVAEQLEAQIITGPPGRARQMNAGAAAATGAILIFCHADTLLPTGYERYVRRVCKDPKMIGAFGLRVDKTGLSMQLIEKLVKMRRTPYGDQALFMHRAAFEALEGFTDMPLLEDVDLIRRARRNGCPIEWLEQHVTTSGRFWRKHGVWRATMINQMVLLAYTLGVSVDKLARFRGGR